MPITQEEKGRRFQALHQQPGVFLIPNPWDAGSACVLAHLGFKALATSSGAAAAVLGREDGQITRDESLAHARGIARATDVPVSADLENGFADRPADVGTTIQLAAEAGLVGCSVEDSTREGERRLYPIELAAERIAAAAAVARALPFPFLLTARAENFVRGPRDLDDTIKRLQAYERAGADVLFAPALPDLAAVRTVCSSVTKPVNFMATIPGKAFTVGELTTAGVKRISVATSLYRAAMTGLVKAAQEIARDGTFNYLDTTIAGPDLYRMFRH